MTVMTRVPRMENRRFNVITGYCFDRNPGDTGDEARACFGRYRGSEPRNRAWRPSTRNYSQIDFRIDQYIIAKLNNAADYDGAPRPIPLNAIALVERKALVEWPASWRRALKIDEIGRTEGGGVSDFFEASFL